MAAGKINMATARQALQDCLDALGYRPPTSEDEEEEEDEDITNLRSDQRLDLVVMTNTHLAQSCRAWEQTQQVLDMYPAQELIRAEGRAVPRAWYQRWQDAGGTVYPGAPEGLPLAEDGQGRCIALVNDPIWERISAFNLPYPPFDFGSGIDVRPVSLADCVELGILTGDENTQDPVDYILKDRPELVLPVAEGPLRDALLADLGDNYEFTADGILRVKE